MDQHRSGLLRWLFAPPKNRRRGWTVALLGVVLLVYLIVFSETPREVVIYALMGLMVLTSSAAEVLPPERVRPAAALRVAAVVCFVGALVTITAGAV